MPSQAQSRRNRREGPKYGLMTVREKALPDSLELARRDSLHRADSLHRVDSVAMLGKSSLSAPAFSSAKDSIVEIFTDGQRKIFYYGTVTVKYDDMELTSDYMEYDMNTGTVYARGVYDSTKAEWVGRPVMKQREKTYNMEELHYNFDTRKARIKNMETSEMDGKLLGRKIKMMPDQSINVSGGRYTVCDADHPHYYLHMTSAKVVTKPSQKTVFGPAWAVFEDVAFPLILPFGFVPKRPERATGLLMPTFGEEQSRGFYMRDLGMYFVFGDHFDLSVTGDYYTLGSWAININSRYKVNYKFNGNFALNYSYDQTGDKDVPGDFFTTTNFGLKWSHSQDSKAHPGLSFSASVNFSSPKNSRYNSHSVNEALQNQTSSSISLSRNWGGKLNLSLSGTHSQNSRDSSYSISLPNLTFSMSTIYPFKRKNRVGKERFYEKFSIGYNTNFTNRVNFKASEFNLQDPAALLEKMENSMTHNFSIGLPSVTLFKYITLSPSVSYGMNWYFRKYDAEYNPETNQVVQSKGRAFSSFGAMHRGSAGMSMSTRLYGTFNFGKYKKVQAIRHVISPSMSFSYNPDLSKEWNGYRDYSYVDAEGNEKLYQYNVYTGSVGRPSGRSATASLSIGNNLEAKVRDLADTTGTGSKKVKLIDQLNINTGYNFLADSLRMNVVSMSMSTSLFNKVSINASASFDPYAVDERGRKYNRFAVAAGQGLLRFTNVSASLSYSISGKGEVKGDDGRHHPDIEGGSDVTQGAASYYQRMYYHPVTGEYIPGGWLYYTNPNVPWSVNFSANFALTRSYNYDSKLEVLKTNNRITATLNMSGNIKLTPRLSINATSGFDFTSMKLTTTQVSAQYDLHCFNIAVQWVPLGTYKSYSFRIAANASALADLLRFKKSNSYWDN